MVLTRLLLISTYYYHQREIAGDVNGGLQLVEIDEDEGFNNDGSNLIL